MSSAGLLSWLGKLWTLPNTLLGLALGVTALLFGGRFRLGDNAVSVVGHPLVDLLGISAITFGNVVLYRRGAHPDLRTRDYRGERWQRLGDHERAHTLQYERWGPLFLPVYLALALVPGIHRLELQADRWAQRDADSRVA